MLPVLLGLGHLVEVLLHGRGETVVHQIGEALFETVGDDLAEFFSVEAPVRHLGIAAILDRGDDRGVGRRTSDAALLQFLDQACFAETRWRRRFVRFTKRMVEESSELSVPENTPRCL